MENLNVTFAERRMTWNARKHELVINYMVVNGRMSEVVSHMWIDENGMVDIVSDHNMLVMACLMQGASEMRLADKERK